MKTQSPVWFQSKVLLAGLFVVVVTLVVIGQTWKDDQLQFSFPETNVQSDGNKIQESKTQPSMDKVHNNAASANSDTNPDIHIEPQSAQTETQDLSKSSIDVIEATMKSINANMVISHK
jgi:hypothetical protein